MPKAKPSLRAEYDELRARMRALGLGYDEIAAEFARRYRLRPRAAYRQAYGWTLNQAADQVNTHAAQTGLDPEGRASMTASHLCEYEQWPAKSGRKPSPHLLALLAHTYDTTIHHLLDIDDWEHLTPADRLLLDKHPGSAATSRHDDHAGPRRNQGPATVHRSAGSDGLPATAVGADTRGPSTRGASGEERGSPAPAAGPAGKDETGGDEWDRLQYALADPTHVDLHMAGTLAQTLAAQRRSEDTLGAPRLLVPAHSALDLVTEFAPHARGEVRPALVALACEYSQFLGWMYTDVGDSVRSLYWYDRAMEWAQESGDTNMVVSILSLKSHLAWRAVDTDRAISLARAGRHTGTGASPAASPGVLSLAAQQEARGHAMAGDADACERHLDTAARLAAEAGAHPEDEPPWVYFQSPDRLVLQRAIAYTELGFHNPRWGAKAAELFGQGLATLPDAYTRDRSWNLARLALAHATIPDVDAAAATAGEAAQLAVRTGSAHAVRDLRRMRRILDPHRHTPAVQGFDALIRDLDLGSQRHRHTP